jgi:hypothetical protein
MFRKLGKVDKIKFRKWCESYESIMYKEKWFGKEIKENRFNLWFGIGINFDKNLSSFEGLKIDKGLEERCREFYGDSFNSLLLMKYENGSKLNIHKDRSCFDNKVVIFNSGYCVFKYDGKEKFLDDGCVYEIDGKKDHGVIKVMGVRYSLSIRKVI